jgi:hypothetical protein
MEREREQSGSGRVEGWRWERVGEWEGESGRVGEWEMGEWESGSERSGKINSNT